MLIKISVSFRKVTVHFLFPDGKKRTVEVKEGINLLDVVLDYDIDIDGFGELLV